MSTNELLVNQRVIVFTDQHVTVDFYRWLKSRTLLWQMLIEHHDHPAPRARFNILAKVRCIGVGNAKSHIAKLPLASATAVDGQLGLIQVALPLLSRLNCSGQVTVLFISGPVWPGAFDRTFLRAVHHLHGFRRKVLRDLHHDADLLPTRWR